MNRMQRKIQKLLDAAVSDNQERGIQIAAYFKGERVIDAWAGAADPEGKMPVDGDTLFPIFSSGKGIVATVIHLLAQRGKVLYDARIAEYWPQFGVNGKEAITVRQALAHTSGIPQMPEGASLASVCDWDRMCAEIAALPPLWTPGSKMEYHAMTFGWILGEVARRVDGRDFVRIMQEEICRPLGIADMYMGIGDEVESRVAMLEEPGAAAAAAQATGPQSVSPAVMPLHAWMNRADARRACIPASNGIMTARALARHYAALLSGGVDGIELLSPERIRLATEAQRLNDGTAIHMGLGYFLGGKDSLMGSRPTAFGHGGYGGSLGFADPECQLALGLTKNLFSKSQAPAGIIKELRQGLGLPE